MNQKIKNKQELIRALQKPSVTFIGEHSVDHDKALADAVQELRKLIRAGRRLSLVTVEVTE